MPPKKKRGGNQSALARAKMSTRSAKKAPQQEAEVQNQETETEMPKTKVKKGKKAVANKTKNKVTFEEPEIGTITPIEQEPVSDTLLVPNIEESCEMALIEEAKNEQEEAQSEVTPYSEKIIKDQSLVVIEQEISEERMDVESLEIKLPESDTCEIIDKLENLEVTTSSENLNITEKESEIDEIKDQQNVDSIQEITVEEGNETFELIDNYGEITVECVTEEFVPDAEDSEVVIAEEAAENEAEIDKQENSESAGIVMEQELPITAPEIKSENEDNNEEKEIIKKDTSSNELEEIKQETSVPVEIKQEMQEEAIESVKAVEKREKPKPSKKQSAKPKKPTNKEPKKPQAKDKSKSKQAEKKLDKTEEVRRSSRIKSISVQKQRSKGHGLVKTTKTQEPEPVETANIPIVAPNITDTDKPVDSPTLSISSEPENKPVKVKSRWRRSSELEMNVLTPAAVVMETCGDSEKIAEANAALEKKLQEDKDKADQEVEMRLKQFVHLKENLYLTDRMTCKEAKKMTCDCFLTPEEIERGEMGCGEDCLNRLLMIECGSLCPIGDRCTNKKFQKSQFAPVEVFKTEKKGLGLRAAANIPYGEFILEYVGEVLNHEEFDIRADDYSNDKNRHYYFMSLRADAIIDATGKGNISRFINHSCDPNAETQKWTVNGELRIGFFSTRTILAGEEITFDYRFQRYGKEAQKCYCEAATCRGWLGEEPDDEDEDDEEEEEEDDEETESEDLKKDTSTLSEIAAEKTDSEAIEESKPKEAAQKAPKKERKKRTPRKKVRKDIFEDLDQLDDEIDMLVTTGLKNQAHTLKLSRLMVRAKEPTQRAKLLRVLRRGELPCRRLFLDYHGLRLIHGYMTDAQCLAKTDKKYESLRLEMLQTLATLPIPNKTMLQDSKVLSTVETWSCVKGDDLPIDSDSCSPKAEQDGVVVAEDVIEKEDPIKDVIKSEDAITTEVDKTEDVKDASDQIQAPVLLQDDVNINEIKDVKPDIEVKSDEPNYEEEITALALKLLEEWSNLKEVFKIPKKERIEQMKEHEREANRGYIAAGLGLDQDLEKKNESRYRILKRYRSIDKIDASRNKNIKLEDRTFANFPKLGKYERRKMFALQVEQREEERRRKQREMWRQHEQHCILLGTDPRLTAPYDPNRGYQCIWNPQIGQWQNYPLQNPNLMMPPNPGYPYMQPNLHNPQVLSQLHPLPSLPYQEDVKKDEDCTQVKFLGPIPPPAKLPPKWKCAKDKYGRPYYYHVKIRKSQWEPPTPPPEDQEDSSETTSSSDTSSLSSDTSSDDSESEDDVDDTQLLLHVRRQMENQTKTATPNKNLLIAKCEEKEIGTTPSSGDEEQEDEIMQEKDKEEDDEEVDKASTTVDSRINEIFKEETKPSNKRKRTGLVQEIIISPRTEEDRLQFREDLKRYKLNKEKLKREKELILQQSKKHSKEKRPKTIIKLKIKEMNDSNSEHAKRIKETFRTTMATVVVAVLNAYRKPDCKEGRITNTEDFKHLARKLTHFVMLKEMKHIEKIDDLVCTENVKAKAREYIRKYMSKFGENYQKRSDEPDY